MPLPHFGWFMRCCVSTLLCILRLVFRRVRVPCHLSPSPCQTWWKRVEPGQERALPRLERPIKVNAYVRYMKSHSHSITEGTVEN